MQFPIAGFQDLATWTSKGTLLTTDTPPFVAQLKAGAQIVIQPSLSTHTGLTILAADWLPVDCTGHALVQQMIHTPALYLGKARSVRQTDTGLEGVYEVMNAFQGDAVLVGGSRNYYHWFIEHLPRLLFASKFTDLSTRQILLNKDLADFQLESLKLLGLQDQLLALDDNEAVRPRTTLVPASLASSTVAHPAIPLLLKHAFPPKKRIGEKKRIYLSRQDASTRQLANEDALVALLSQYGFERHLPGGMTFQEQVNLCAEAEAVFAVHGAAMANMVFCPKRTRIFEVYSPLWKVSSMFALSQVCGHKHVFVPARNLSFGPDGNPLLGTWEVDLVAVEQALMAAFKSSKFIFQAKLPG